MKLQYETWFAYNDRAFYMKSMGLTPKDLWVRNAGEIFWV